MLAASKSRRLTESVLMAVELHPPLARMASVSGFVVLVAMNGLAASSGESILSVLGRVCVQCHGATGPPHGGIDLRAVTGTEDLAARPELVRKLVRVLDAGVMPPPGGPSIPAEDRERAVGLLRSMLPPDEFPQGPAPRVPVRRMNRFQYANAIQDLFDLSVEVFALPERMLRDYGYFRPETGKMPDELKAGSRPLGKSQLIGKRLAGVTPFPQDLRAEHGYDNRADHLSLSPLLLESFLKLATAIVDSPDFNAVTSGEWERLFGPPEAGEATRAAVRRALGPFLTLAFRQEVDTATLERYSDFALGRIKGGQPYADGIRAAVSAALASPRFLYLHEVDGKAGRNATSRNVSLASRLSFFLWGSIPDLELLQLADAGKLNDPETLARQADRMLRDARLKRFCDSFAPQWLQLERIVSSVPDRELFPDFYFAKFRASMHMMLEPLLLFETVLIENRPILELVDSDFSYRSELLETWYRDGTRPEKVPPVAIPFRRVSIDDRRQGGVITTAAVMTMTSGPAESRPITRGAWMAGVVFNDPPAPPPPEVSPLPVVEDGPLTLRERLEAHRSRPDCAACHASIDPLGFALENYGPTGVWRETYDNGHAVDASGVLFGRHAFADVTGLKQAILAERDRFARGFAAHLLEFALGRQLAPWDEPALDEIVRRSAQGGYRMQDMIKQVVLSAPFRGNRSAGETYSGKP